MNSTLMVSDSSSVTSYSTTIDSYIDQEPLNITDPDWFQFLLDHRQLIRENSIENILTEEVMYVHRYRIRKYLKSLKNYSPDLELAFRVVNRLGSNMDFNLSLQSVYVPDKRYVTELRRKYNTNKSKLNKL